MNSPDKPEDVQKPCVQSQEIPALGQLAEAFAHKIRNHLGIVLAGVGYLSKTLPQEERSRVSIDKIKRAVHIADKIICDFLRFCAMSEFAFESLDLCNLLDESVSAIKNSPNFNQIKIERDYPEEPITVKADKNMLQQVFINLFTNALDAMPNRGELKIRAFPEIGSKAGRITGNDLKVGDEMAVVEIEDTGKGIPKDVLPRIFEPFFTGNKLSKGTGLGLSMVDLIVDRHQGSVDVESKINKGTRFTVKLPQSRIPEKSINITNRKKILLIDDEEDFCFFFKEDLESTGEFKVITATSGKKGIMLARSEKPDLVLLDLYMPEMSGDDVIVELRDDPETDKIPVIFHTALVTQHDLGMERRKKIAGCDFIAKPLSTEELVSAIKKIMGWKFEVQS